MSEAERSDRAERRRAATARLARSPLVREAAAAAHAANLRALALASSKDGASSPGEPRPLSTMETKVLDAAGDILTANGGQALADQIEAFVAAHAIAGTP